MSLTIHESSPDISFMPDDGERQAERDIGRLNRYLAILENNRKACAFVPGDALLALDMAGFIRSRLNGVPSDPQISTRRLALSLVQSHPAAPVQ